MFIPLHKSSVTGRYQVSGLLFLTTENRENVLSGLKMFKNALPFTSEDLKVRFHFVCDKDFDYIEVGCLNFCFLTICLPAYCIGFSTLDPTPPGWGNKLTSYFAENSHLLH